MISEEAAVPIGFKGLPGAVLKARGVAMNDRGDVIIPYYLESGELHNRKIFRRAPGGGWSQRYETTGKPLVLYGLEALTPATQAATRTLFIAECESDTLALLSIDRDYPECDVLGVPGSMSWRSEWAEIPRRYRLTYVLADGDEAGQALAWRIKQDVPAARIVALPTGADVRDVIQSDGGRARLETLFRETDALAITEAAVLSGASLEETETAILTGEPLSVAEKSTTRTGVELIPFDEIRREAVSWLPSAEGRIPVGLVTVLAGQEGLGKSMYACELAARLSRLGKEALFLAAEDSPGATLRPRLEAAGAELDRIHLVKMWREGLEDGLRLPADAQALGDALAGRNVSLIVIDPMMAHLDGGVDSHKDQSTRAALVPLCRLARDHGCAVLLVMHLNKAIGIDALKRIGGSVAFTAGARSVLLLARDPDDPEAERGRQRVLAHIKCNVAPLAPSQVYELTPIDLGTGDAMISTARIAYLHDSDYCGDDLLAAPATTEEREDHSEAELFLITELGSQARVAGELLRLAAQAGISHKTLRHAYRTLGGLKPQKSAFAGGWMWQLPINEALSSEGAEGDQDDPGAEGRNLGDLGPAR